jgi:hypothetical protein
MKFLILINEIFNFNFKANFDYLNLKILIYIFKNLIISINQ